MSKFIKSVPGKEKLTSSYIASLVCPRKAAVDNDLAVKYTINLPIESQKYRLRILIPREYKCGTFCRNPVDQQLEILK